METLRKELSKKYDLPGAQPDGRIRLGIPKDHPDNPYYPDTRYYNYSCSFEGWRKRTLDNDRKFHWDYRGIPHDDFFSYSLNPHKDTTLVKSFGLCRPMFQRNFKTEIDQKIILEMFDDLQPMPLSHKLD